MRMGLFHAGLLCFAATTRDCGFGKLIAACSLSSQLIAASGAPSRITGAASFALGPLPPLYAPRPSKRCRQ